ncbi:DUF3067 family protein [Streptomyces sp. TLI_171]|nr:DUF3067 family protein [Streptomyces sp. TLI_171]
MTLLHLREHLSAIARGDNSWGATDAVRTAIAPFRHRPTATRPK